MAATAIQSTALDVLGTNLTDLALTTLVVGAGNGVEFTWSDTRFVVLKNDTAGVATVTLKVRTFPHLTEIGVTPGDKTITIAAGKTYLLKLSAALRNSSDKTVIECDVAIGVAVLHL